MAKAARKRKGETTTRVKTPTGQAKDLVSAIEALALERQRLEEKQKAFLATLTEALKKIGYQITPLAQPGQTRARKPRRGRKPEKPGVAGAEEGSSRQTA